jgi:hypothetical protein
MEITDIWQVVTNPQIWPLFLTFLGGYVMMNVFIGRDRLKKQQVSDLERLLIALGIGFLFEYFLFLPTVFMISLWVPYLGENAYMVSSILFCSVSAGALFFGMYAEGRDSSIDGAKKILRIAIVIFSFVVALTLSIGWSVSFWYPYYILSLIWKGSLSFMQLSCISFLLFLAGMFFLWIYVLKLSPAFLKSFPRQLLADMKHRLFKKRVLLRAFAVVIIVSAVGFSIVPIELSLGLFTPRMQKGPEMFSSALVAGNGFQKVLFMNATRGPGNNVSSVCQYYAFLNTTYNITLPSRGLLSSVYVDNPSNASFSVGQYYPSLPSPTDTSMKMYVTVPDNVTYDAVIQQTPSLENEVTGLVFSFGNFSGNAFLATLSYWQKISSINNVTVEYGNLTFNDLGNGTYTETHTILISNNSSDLLFIPALDYDRFNFDYVIRNSTTVWMNGSLIPYAELVWQNRLALDVSAPPHTLCNLTISFQTTRNTE